jgi:hypothetical protein
MTDTTGSQKLPLDEVSAGMSLAESVLSEQGDVVLSQGVALTESLIQALRRRGVQNLLVTGADVASCNGALPAADSKAHLARLDRLFRQAAGQSGAEHLRALLTRYRTGAMP